MCSKSCKNTFTCSFCKDIFVRSPRKKGETPKYCSHACYMAYKQDNKKLNYHECEVCKKLYYRSKAHNDRSERNFCSRKCSNIGQSGIGHHHYEASIHGVKCKNCKGEFTSKKNGQGKRTVFCSNRCKGEYRATNENRIVVSVNCDECQKQISRQPSHINKTNFCNKDCASKFHSKRMKGKNNSNYIHGKLIGNPSTSRVWIGFTENIKEEVRERDNRECVICGINRESHGMALHVHHIDYSKDNHSIDNLITLCRYCHGKVHGKRNRKIWQKKLLSLLNT